MDPEVARLAMYATKRVPQKPGKKRLEMRRQRQIAALADEVAKEEAEKLRVWRNRE